MKKKKIMMWFGCPNCKHKPDKEEHTSNENWNVFSVKPCPVCKTEMRINFEDT